MFCNRCQLFWDEALEKAQIPENFERPQDIIWAPHELVLHASLRELKKSSNNRCRICRLIYHLPSEFEHAALLKDDDEKIHVILGLHAAHRALPLLQAEFREGSSDEIRIPKRMIASCNSGPGAKMEGCPSGKDFTAMLDKAVKLDNDNTGSDSALQLASYWIKTCVDTHEDCRSKSSMQSSSFMPTRVLDVSSDRVRLVQSECEVGKTTRERSYVALSHCWGLTQIIRTLKYNYKQHAEAIPWKALSKTFREAIHTTRKLGFRYIWIDSLCIIQDDNDDWATEAAAMCDVYRHAVLTIAAAHAEGGDIGCFADRDGLLNLPFYVDLSSHMDPVAPAKLFFTSYGRYQMRDLGGGDPALYGRAWVLQEQLLSPRLLIFDRTQLRWECLTIHGTESSPNSGTTRSSLSHKLVRSTIMDGRDFFAYNDSRQQHGHKDFWPHIMTKHWCAIIMDYTHRGMTKPSDRLAALAGIGQALSRHSKHDFMAGLWSIDFFIGLLWSLSHHEKYHMSATRNFDVENNSSIRHKQPVAPSWSWASVTAPVMYGDQITLNNRICEISNVQVSGSIDEQAGQVTIRGHVRTGYINAVYPYTMREAVAKAPTMTAPAPAGHMGLESLTFQDRCFHPNEYFLFSDRNPDPNGCINPAQVHRKGSFRFVRGSFRPDELISPSQELTFIAIAQRHHGGNRSSRLGTSYDHDPVSVQTLALVPTEDESGTYRRVGLAVWDDCAWYGYLCGWKEDFARRVTTPREWKDGFRVKGKDTGWVAKWRKLWWDDMELYECTERVGGDGEDGRWKHQHEFQGGQLPDRRMYKEGVMVQEKTVVIV